MCNPVASRLLTCHSICSHKPGNSANSTPHTLPRHRDGGNNSTPTMQLLRGIYSISIGWFCILRGWKKTANVLNFSQNGIVCKKTVYFSVWSFLNMALDMKGSKYQAILGCFLMIIVYSMVKYFMCFLFWDYLQLLNYERHKRLSLKVMVKAM